MRLINPNVIACISPLTMKCDRSGSNSRFIDENLLAVSLCGARRYWPTRLLRFIDKQDALLALIANVAIITLINFVPVFSFAAVQTLHPL